MEIDGDQGHSCALSRQGVDVDHNIHGTNNECIAGLRRSVPSDILSSYTALPDAPRDGRVSMPNMMLSRGRVGHDNVSIESHVLQMYTLIHTIIGR